MPTPIPVAPVPAGGNRAIVPAVVVLSLASHAAAAALITLLPAPAHIEPAPAVLAIEIAQEPEPAPPPEPPPPEPELAPPPEPVAAVVDRPRRRPRRETPPPPPEEAEPAEPAPPAPILAAEPGAGSWSHEGGDPNGRMGGEPGGTARSAVVPAQPGEPDGTQHGISRSQLRRMLAGYIRDTLSRFLDGRIEYPLAARREHMQGVVVLRIRLARDGRILACRLSRSSGHAMLDRAALASVQRIGTMPAPPREIPWDDDRELPLPVTYVLQ